MCSTQMKRFSRQLIFILTAGLLTTGFTSTVPETASASATQQKPLVIGIFPRRNATNTIKMFQPLTDYLSKQLGRPVKLVTARDFSAFWDGVVKQRYDIVHYNQLHYIESHKNYGYQVILANEEFGVKTICGTIMVRTDGGIDKLSDLKGKRVWVPEGDSISYASMEALSLSPVTLPLTDVLTGLQTGLLDIVAIPPYVALILQWHTKVKYVTRVPLVYTFGFMAVDKKTFEKIGAEDQAIVHEVMGRIYKNFDKVNLVDNAAAFDALLNSGIKSVEFDQEEFIKTRKVLLASNRQLGEQGKFSLELYDEMMRYLDEYRSQHGASGPD